MKRSDSTPQRRPFAQVVSFMIALSHHARQYHEREKWLLALLDVQMHTSRREWS